MIRVAVVGTGGIAGICHMPALAEHADRAQPVAAVDPDAARLSAFRAEHSVPAGYADLATMLEAERPDLVHLCTPPFLHAEQVIACLRAGAHVWCEKPLCLSLAEYEAIAAAERETGRYAAVVFQHRFGSGARHLRELVEAGTLGRPLVVRCDTTWYRPPEYFEVPWRGRWETEGGGPTMGHGIHQMDLMLSVLGEWEEIRAMAGRLDREVETEDVSTALIRFGNGAMATVVNSLLSRREESYLRFDLTDATVELRHLYGYRNADWSCSSPLWDPGEDVSGSHGAQLGAVLDALEHGERPPVGGDGARRTVELITGLYASAFTGRPVLRKELTPDHPEFGRFHARMNGGMAL
ncbi:gfo/Idh/MocA family oxidoreductase [Streptomyces alkaliphilus]|uniref:Gfo/Idh/MocA family oxidoreductase n=1 Tax=Streptomyces alkaliphilus TaxID=1472722 RepID=A0A7W3Y3E9_9ACTN|nr:Gfo/Idh/MocA family oxidoreductase [Streptomyces alkaliphilus]MBB0246237.1 gfo/Idh/MocA family oxidoreductase [Streptomyces alkaliphilus]